MIWIRLLAGVLLVAHGLVHLLFLAEDQDAFDFESSWLLPDSVRRPTAYALMAVTVALFVLVGLAVWGVPGLSAAWPALTVAASVVGLVLLLVFWDVQLVWGALINVGLLLVAVTRPGWMERLWE